MSMIKVIGRTVRGMVQTMTETQAGFATLAARCYCSGWLDLLRMTMWTKPTYETVRLGEVTMYFKHDETLLRLQSVRRPY